MSVVHPGSSINFDEVAMQQNDEDEMYQEDMKQQKELQELLAAELSDDLLEDDLSVNNSHQSLSYHSTNNSLEAPTHFNQQNNENSYVSNGSNSFFEENNGMKPAYSDYQNGGEYVAHQQHQYYYTSPYNQQPQWPRPQQHMYTNPPVTAYERENGVGQFVSYETNEHGFPYQERGEVEGREDYETMMDGFANNGSDQQTPQQPPHVEYKPQMNRDEINRGRQSFPPTKPASPFHSKGFNTSDGNPIHKPRSSNDVSFVNQTVKDQEYAQLQILYKARGKKVEELTKEIEALKYDAARDKRMLRHQLTMSKDQIENMTSEMNDCKRKFELEGQNVVNLKATINSLRVEVDSLHKAKLELTNKLEVSECTISSLHEQIAQLSCVDTLERATSQHDKVVMAMSERFEQQLLEVNQKFDECKNQLTEKTEESEDLHERLKRTLNESEKTLIDKTDTINRLTRGLEEAQKQCQGLLNGEGFGLKQKYEDAIAVKNQVEDENEQLKSKIEDAERHLLLYENALRLGSTHQNKEQTVMSQSYNEMMGRSSDVRKKLVWDEANKDASETSQQNDLVEKLRQELERALACNKSKREEISRIKKQMQELEEESKHWRKRADEAQVELGMMSTSQLLSQTESREDLKLSLKDALDKITMMEEEYKKLEEESNDVKRQMVEMVQEHDTNKREAVARCERACMQLNEDAKHKLRDELSAQYDQKLYETELDFEERIENLNNEICCLKSELMEVKQNYVRVCSEKENVKKTLEADVFKKASMDLEELIAKHEKEIRSLEERLAQEKKEEISELIRLHGDEMKKMREDIEQEQSKEVAQQIETKIALAKISWVEEYAVSKQKCIEAAIAEKNAQLDAKIETMKGEWKQECTKDLEVEIEILREELERTKNDDLKKQLIDLEKELNLEKETAIRTTNAMNELNMKVLKENLLKESANELKKKEESWKIDKDAEVDKVKKGMQEIIDDLEGRVRIANDKMKTHEEQIRKNDEKFKNKIQSIEESHRSDYEKFMTEHRNNLQRIIKQKSVDDSSAQTLFDFEEEKRQILLKHSNEFQEMQHYFNGRCHDLQLEVEKLLEERQSLQYQLQDTKKNEQNNIESHKISMEEIQNIKNDFQARINEINMEVQSLKSEKDELASKLHQKNIEINEISDARSKEIETLRNTVTQLENSIEQSVKKEDDIIRKHKQDTANLKDRMREEYKRWKKERSDLQEQIKQSVCDKCSDATQQKNQLLSSKDEASRAALQEMGDMYAKTLTAIKAEVMSFVAESRGRSRDTISRERKRTAEKVRTHYQQIIKSYNPELVDKLAKSAPLLGDLKPRETPSSTEASFLRDTPRSENENQYLGGIQAPDDVTKKVEEWRKNSWRSNSCHGNVNILCDKTNSAKLRQPSAIPPLRMAASSPIVTSSTPVMSSAQFFTPSREVPTKLQSFSNVNNFNRMGPR